MLGKSGKISALSFIFLLGCVVGSPTLRAEGAKTNAAETHYSFASETGVTVRGGLRQIARQFRLNIVAVLMPSDYRVSKYDKYESQRLFFCEKSLEGLVKWARNEFETYHVRLVETENCPVLLLYPQKHQKWLTRTHSFPSQRVPNKAGIQKSGDIDAEKWFSSVARNSRSRGDIRNLIEWVCCTAKVRCGVLPFRGEETGVRAVRGRSVWFYNREWYDGKASYNVVLQARQESLATRLARVVGSRRGQFLIGYVGSAREFGYPGVVGRGKHTLLWGLGRREKIDDAGLARRIARLKNKHKRDSEFRRLRKNIMDEIRGRGLDGFRRMLEKDGKSESDHQILYRLSALPRFRYTSLGVAHADKLDRQKYSLRSLKIYLANYDLARVKGKIDDLLSSITVSDREWLGIYSVLLSSVELSENDRERWLRIAQQKGGASAAKRKMRNISGDRASNSSTFLERLKKNAEEERAQGRRSKQERIRLYRECFRRPGRVK